MSGNLILKFLYNTYLGRIILKPLVSSSFISNLSYKFFDSKFSKILIKSFIKKNNIDISEYEDKKYNSFNDFFIRKIKIGKRKIDYDKNSFIAPCDSNLTCYKITDNLTFNIKGSSYDISSLTNSNLIDYKDGYVLVFRLAPFNYHRYCFIDDCVLEKSYKIKGKFHSVNPICYDKFKVFKENERNVSFLKTSNFNNIIYIEVGALLVGKIVNHDIKKAKKGIEKGFFEYGGSTIIIIVKNNIINIDKQILNNSKINVETSVKYGQKIAKKII